MRERETRGKSGSEEGAGADPSRHLLGVQSLVANRLYDAAAQLSCEAFAHACRNF